MRFFLGLAALVLLAGNVAWADGPTALELQNRLASGSGGNPGQFTTITGDASATTVRTTGAVVGRSLASRLSESIDIRDFGASCDGKTDDTSALLAAQLNGQGRGGAMIIIPPACALNLKTTIYTVSTNAWNWGAGSYLTGSAIQGVLDQTQYNMQSWSKASAYAGNENGMAIYDLYDPVSGTVNYQKNGLYVRTFQVDPSTYSNPQTITTMHDVVGIESQAGIIQSNPSGRVWAYHGACGVDPGSDGQCISGEFEIYNNGGYEPLAGRFDSKIGLHVTAMGTQDSSVGIAVGGVKHWETELLFLQRSLRADGMAWQMVAPDGLTSVASMSYDGTIATNGRFINAAGQELAPDHPGIAVSRFYYGVSAGGAGTSLSNLASQIAWTPFRNPVLTHYGKIGANIVTGAAGASCIMNIYNSQDGIPSGSPLLTSTPSVQASATGDSEAGIDLTLPSGLYFIGIACSSSGVSVSTYVENDAIGLIGTSSSSGTDTSIRSSNAGSFTAKPVVIYTSNNNQMVKIWLRRY